MIQSNELRRGNIIGYCNPQPAKPMPAAFEGGLRVNEIKIEQVSAVSLKIELAFGLFYTEIEGIPLTPELLEKMGFPEIEFYPDARSFQLDNMGFYFIANTLFHKLGRPDIQDKKTAIVLNWDVKYLHQLQNLFFALTGGELPIKNI